MCRAYPDVAMLSVDYEIVVNARNIFVGGTSASAPLFAAFLSLVNAERVRLGLGTVGFVNPVLYTAGMDQFNYSSQHKSIDGSDRINHTASSSAPVSPPNDNDNTAEERIAADEGFGGNTASRTWFNDITSGDNSCCEESLVLDLPQVTCCESGFAAGKQKLSPSILLLHATF